MPLPCPPQKSHSPLQPSDKVHIPEYGIRGLNDTAPMHLNNLISNYLHFSSKIGSCAQATLNVILILHFLGWTMIFHSSKLFCLKFTFPLFLPIVILQGPAQMLPLSHDLLQPLQTELALSSSYHLLSWFYLYCNNWYLSPAALVCYISKLLPSTYPHIEKRPPLGCLAICEASLLILIHSQFSTVSEADLCVFL